jgi:hypothetical protein
VVPGAITPGPQSSKAGQRSPRRDIAMELDQRSGNWEIDL